MAIIGVGLMGGSLGLALKKFRLAGTVVGIDASADTLAKAKTVGAIDRGTSNLEVGLSGAECVVIATPVNIIPEILRFIAPYVSEVRLITDIGSVKQQIVAVGEELYAERFVGGHPMAGSESGGINSAIASLFEGAAWGVVREKCFNPSEPVANSSLSLLTALITGLGAHPVYLDVSTHDRIVALNSHLPHLLSFAFSNTILNDSESSLAREMAGGSFRDLIRVSASDPQLWSEIFVRNRAAIINVLARYQENLTVLKSAVETGDTSAIASLLTTRE